MAPEQSSYTKHQGNTPEAHPKQKNADPVTLTTVEEERRPGRCLVTQPTFQQVLCVHRG